jgi:subtilisin family serine protease
MPVSFATLRVAITALLPFALNIHPSSASAENDSSPSKRAAPGVVVSFEGGVVGQNIAKVLEKALELPDKIPTETYILQVSDTTCGILQAQGYPPPCEPMARILDRLNPLMLPSRGKLKEGDAILLPRIKLRQYETGQIFSTRSPQEQRKGYEALQNWKDLKAFKVETSPTSFDVRYFAYEIYLPTRSDAESKFLRAKLEPVSSTNVLVDILRQEPVSTKPNGFPTLSEYEQWCKQGTAVGRIFDYRDLSDYELDALELVRAGLPRTSSTVKVHPIDIELKPSPNLYPAFGPEPPVTWTCSWEKFIPSVHHATHLAGIIAGHEPTNYGFKGLAPNVLIRPFKWAVPHPTNKDEVVSADEERGFNLAQQIRTQWSEPPPRRVYVAAISFDPWDRELVNGQLRDAAMRFLRPLENTIKGRRPLLIAAAGQVPDNRTPVEISPKTPLFPQNLGDLPSVIVVTACEHCTRTNTKLHAKANFASGDRRFVHVVAPGGGAIPGWISDQHIGGAAGTSQSAAYVAGIVAAMLSYYSDDYADPGTIKTRLQVTSRPIAALTDGSPNPDAAKIAAGVVDPVLALLDPSKHWIKENGSWRHVRIRSWSSAGMSFRDSRSGQIFVVMGNYIRRIVRTPEPGPRIHFTIYTDRSLEEDVQEGEIRRVGPVRPVGSPRPALTLCDGTASIEKPLEGIEDLIIGLSGVQENECESS